MDPTLDLTQIAKAIGSHNWLALVLGLSLYARVLLSDKSRFPATVHPELRPLLFGAASAVVLLVTAREAGHTWLQSSIEAAVGLVSGGFLDGMAAAIFGSPDKAPKWAQWAIMVADEVLKPPTAPKTPTDPTPTTAGSGSPHTGGERA